MSDSPPAPPSDPICPPLRAPAMAGMAPEGSQFDVKQYEARLQELLHQGEPDDCEFFTPYDEVCEIFYDKGLQENLLRAIHVYGFEMPPAIQQKETVPFCEGLDVVQQAQTGS